MAEFINNRNNGQIGNRAPSIEIEQGFFMVPTGLGSYIPYSESITVRFSGLTGTFALGETVTQATSGATGIVLAQTSLGIVLGSVTGTFDATHGLTGGTSGATATATSVVTNDKIFGISNTVVQSTDADFATSGVDINMSTPVNVLDYLIIPVSAGTAIASMVGTYVNVDPANPGSVDVSAVGTQIYISKVIDADTIQGIIALTV